MKYKTKPIQPVEIEAIQYTGYNFEIEKWSNGLVFGSPVLEPIEDNPTGHYLQIPWKNEITSGVDIVIVGDWIIKNKEGFFSVCSSDDFEKTYELIN